MAFASGPVSFQRFSISGAEPADVTDAFVEAVNTRAFGKSPALSDDTQIGWIGPRHLFDTTITAEHVAFGRFVHLGLRIDRLGVPANVLRSYARIEEETVLRAGGREFLSRAEKQKAREAAKSRADAEVRAGEFRRMNSTPVLIDLDGRTVFVGSLGASVAEKAMLLFSETFGCALEPVDPERLAMRMIGAARDGRALEQLAPCRLTSPPKGLGEEGADFAAGDLSFLGKEFLTWLWYRIDADDGPLRVRAGDDVTVMVDRTLRLQCDFGITGSVVITADSPAGLPEARAAIKIGKQPTQMGLILGGRLGEFRFALDGARLACSGVVLPEVHDERDARARIEGRFESIVDLTGLLDALFELFLRHRTGAGWSAELRAMTAWATGKPSRGIARARAASA